MKFYEVLNSIKRKDFARIYTLCGEESFFIDELEKAIVGEALDESEKAFNLTTVYGKDVQAGALMEMAQAYPMMAERKVILLREAQSMKGFYDLEPYAKNPTESTILVIVYKHEKLDGRKPLTKALKKKPNLYFESKRLYQNKVPKWIKGYLGNQSVKIQEREVQLLSEYLGTDISKIANELNKLLIHVPKGSVISGEVIEEHIGISKDYNIFELQDAIVSKNAVKAEKIISYFISDIKNHHPVMVVSILASYFGKLLVVKSLSSAPKQKLKKMAGLYNDYILSKYVTAANKLSMAEIRNSLKILFEFDLRSKGVHSKSTSSQDLLKELTFTLIQGKNVDFEDLFSNV